MFVGDSVALIPPLIGLSFVPCLLWEFRESKNLSQGDIGKTDGPASRLHISGRERPYGSQYRDAGEVREGARGPDVQILLSGSAAAEETELARRERGARNDRS
jgi:hypothetical protein